MGQRRTASAALHGARGCGSEELTGASQIHHAAIHRTEMEPRTYSPEWSTSESNYPSCRSFLLFNVAPGFTSALRPVPCRLDVCEAEEKKLKKIPSHL